MGEKDEIIFKFIHLTPTMFKFEKYIIHILKKVVK